MAEPDSLVGPDQTLTHRDLAAQLGVSETTIKSYRRKFPEFFPVHSRGKPIRFRAQAADVAREIKQCFHENLSVAEIRERLSELFPILGAKERLDPARNRPLAAKVGDPRTAGQLAEAVQALRQGLGELGELQNRTNERLDKLQELMADFLNLHVAREDTFSRGMEDLRQAWSEQLGALERMFGQAGESQQGRDRRILVKNAYGGTSEYVFRSAEEDQAQHGQETVAEPRGAEEVMPPDELLGLPLVVETGHGEYLGVAGKAAGPFSLSDFFQLLDYRYPQPRHFSLAWRRLQHGWQVQAEQADTVRPKQYLLEVRRTRTPRGNLVALLEKLEENRVDLPPANLFAVIKQLREMNPA